VHVLHTCLAKLKSKNLSVYSTRGQHDLAETDWLYACGGDASPGRHSRVQLANVSFAFVPWTPPSILAEIMAETKADVVVCHQVWQELMGGSSSEGKLANFAGVKMAISGDYHRRVLKFVRRKGEDPLYVLSPGATHMRKINEPTTHCVAVLHDDYSVKWVKLKSRKVMRASVGSEADVEATLRSLPSALADVSAETSAKGMPSELVTPLLIVTDTSDIVGVEPRLREVVGDRAHLFYSSRGAAMCEDEFVPTGSESYSLGEFIKAEAGHDEQVASLLLSLFSPEAKIQETIKTYEQEFFSRANQNTGTIAATNVNFTKVETS